MIGVTPPILSSGTNYSALFFDGRRWFGGVGVCLCVVVVVVVCVRVWGWVVVVVVLVVVCVHVPEASRHKGRRS